MMAIRRFLHQLALKREWQEFKNTSLIFIGIVLTGSLLLMTPIPKELILWSSFVASIIIPAIVLHLGEKRKKLHTEVDWQSIMDYMRPHREDSQPFDKLQYLLETYSLGHKVPSEGIFADLLNPKYHKNDGLSNIQILLLNPIEQGKNSLSYKAIQEIHLSEHDLAWPNLSGVSSPMKMFLKDFNPVSTRKVSREPIFT